MKLTIFSPCPSCGYGNDESKPPNKAAFCQAKGYEVPLRCSFAADAKKYAEWNVERYVSADGKEYKPVIIDGIVDVKKTTNGQELKKPNTIEHAHRECGFCGKTWVEY